MLACGEIAIGGSHAAVPVRFSSFCFGVYRGLRNDSDEDALMCIMLGASKPVTPTYPPDHPVAKLKRK